MHCYAEKSRINEDDNNDECFVYAALAVRRLLITLSTYIYIIYCTYAVFHYIFKATQINQFLYDMNKLQL